MWEQYRRYAVFNQLFIVAACATALWFLHWPWFVVLLVFLLMQLGALVGAAWGARLKRKIEGQANRLPLEDRKR